MPSNYGGDLESIEELHDQNRQLLVDMREYFIAEEDQMNYKFEDRVVVKSSNDGDDFFDAADEWIYAAVVTLKKFVLNFYPLLTNIISIIWPSTMK